MRVFARSLRPFNIPDEGAAHTRGTFRNEGREIPSEFASRFRKSLDGTWLDGYTRAPPRPRQTLSAPSSFASPLTLAKGTRRRQLIRLLAFTAGRRRPIAFALGLTISASTLAAAEPLLLKRLVDALTIRSGIGTVALSLGCLAALHIGRDLLAAVANWLTWRTRLRVQHGLLEATVARLHDLSIAYHRRQSVGVLTSKLERGVQGFMNAFAEVAFTLIPALIFFAVAIVCMWRLDWRLCLALTALVPLPALIGALAAGRQTERDRMLLDRWTRIYGRFNEVLAGMITVKSFAMERAEQRRFVEQSGEANELVLRGVGFDTKVTAAQGLMITLARLTVLGTGAFFAVHNQISIGTLLAFLAYLSGLFGPVQSLTTVYQALRRGAVALDAIFSILDAPDLIEDHSDAREATSVKGDVRFAGVWFGYSNDTVVLRGIDLHIPAGKTFAFVGPSGGGKTTLSVLLQRLYEPQRGTIQIDGIDLRFLTQHSLRRNIGIVMQETAFFNDTVRANIAYGSEGATDAQIEAAARAANAHDFIMALAGGYDANVGERGTTLSAGQRQRIAIARALVKNPPILIMDEATSNLDAETEAQVEAAVAHVMRGRTTLVIAHRLATVMRADQICVLADGEIIEQGTHAQLLATSGTYAHLLATQTRTAVAVVPGKDARRTTDSVRPATKALPPSTASTG
jgi:ATP-binding cassette subfamily B protein